MNLEIHKLNSTFFLPLKILLKMDKHDIDSNDKIGSLWMHVFNGFVAFKKKISHMINFTRRHFY